MLAAVLPTACASCGRGSARGAVLCEGCELKLGVSRELRGGAPAGVDSIWSAAHHDGVARDLVNALKHRRSLRVADRMAEEMVRRAPRATFEAPLVPAPSRAASTRKRGFAPASELARSLAERSGGAVLELLRSGPGPSQVGQSRGERRAGALDVAVAGPVPPRCILVDDVTTTGGTLTASAAALRSAGALRVSAVTFTRRW